MSKINAKIKTNSRILTTIIKWIMLSLPIFTIGLWLSLTNFPNAIPDWLSSCFLIPTPEGLFDLRKIIWQANNALIGFLADMISVSTILIGLGYLARVFKRYANNAVFTGDNAYDYRRLGYVLIIYNLIIKPINGLLTTLAMTLNNGVGHRFISISLNGTNFQGIFLGIIVIVIANVMLEAAQLADDQELII